MLHRFRALVYHSADDLRLQLALRREHAVAPSAAELHVGPDLHGLVVVAVLLYESRAPQYRPDLQDPIGFAREAVDLARNFQAAFVAGTVEFFTVDVFRHASLGQVAR